MRLKTVLLFIGLTIILTSCTFTEEISIANNGSGSYSLKMDMGQMMKSMNGMSPKDSLKKPKVLDSIVHFKDILEKNKDSIAKLPKNEQLALEALRNMNLHMQVDEEKDKMLMDFNLAFNNVSELKNMQEKITKAQLLSDKKGKDKSMPSKADVNYLFNGKTFKRKVIPKELSEEKLSELERSIKQSGAFLEGSTYRVVYHFEKKIKSVSFRDAKISDDKKTMTIEVPMDSLVKNPMLLNFEVKLK